MKRADASLAEVAGLLSAMLQKFVDDHGLVSSATISAVDYYGDGYLTWALSVAMTRATTGGPLSPLLSLVSRHSRNFALPPDEDAHMLAEAAARYRLAEKYTEAPGLVDWRVSEFGHFRVRELLGLYSYQTLSTAFGSKAYSPADLESARASLREPTDSEAILCRDHDALLKVLWNIHEAGYRYPVEEFLVETQGVNLTWTKK
jgi:hypothetical protein